MNHQPPERWHALDALRASMMLFGIVMHAGLSYDGVPATPLWGISDTHITGLAPWLQGLSRLFRMQAFFLVAGFFAALLHAKRGLLGMLKNRVARIAGPLIAAWVVTFTLLRLAFAAAAAIDSPRAAYAQDGWSIAALWSDPYPIHLWFLEYLLIYYALAALAVLMLDRLPENWRAQTKNRLATLLHGNAAPFLLTALLLPVLAIAPSAEFGIPLSFRPRPSSLASYGVCFAFGWLLHGFAPTLPHFASRGPIWLGAGLVAAVVLPADPGINELVRPAFVAIGIPVADPAEPEASTITPPSTSDLADARALDGQPWFRQGAWSLAVPLRDDPIGHLADALATSLATSLLVMGVLGTFLRWFNRPTRWFRYFADASYWLYLGHFPVVAWVSVALLPLDIPGSLKLFLTSSLTMGLLLAGYECAVRTTWLGLWLNGKFGAPPPWQQPA